MLLKGSRISEGFPSLLQYIVLLQFDILNVVFGNWHERRYSIYVASLRFVTDCIITFA
jgi:hypothetical protein